MLTRREFLKTGFLGALFLSCSPKRDLLSILSLGDPDPIRSVFILGLKDFLGDDYQRAHDFLRFEKGKNFSVSKTEKSDFVIVGGGMAGLCAAYFLKDHQPIVLEQASQFGGNSKGEEWQGMPYSLGAAYITCPEEGSEVESFLKELNVFSSGRVEVGSDGAVVLDGGHLVKEFWQGATDLQEKLSFKKTLDKLTDIYQKNYPSIPYDPEGNLKQDTWNALDRMSFAAWMQKELPDLHPHIAEFLCQYCWSSFGGGPEELSAAQALNFVTSDLQGTMAFPGGNSAITRALYRHLQKTLPISHLRPLSIVTKIALRDEGVEVTYVNGGGEKRIIQAKKCIVALPKFVAKHIIPDLPTSQREIMNRISYRSYVVGNILIRGKISSPSYELFRLARLLPQNNREDLLKRPFTDLVFGNWANHDGGENSVLTLYKAYPFEGARAFLMAPGAYQKIKKDFEKGLPEIISALNIKSSQIADLRLTLWGHALPLAAPGMLADGICAQASQSIADKIFFAEQDNCLNPCFETAFGEARSVALKLNHE